MADEPKITWVFGSEAFLGASRVDLNAEFNRLIGRGEIKFFMGKSEVLLTIAAEGTHRVLVNRVEENRERTLGPRPRPRHVLPRLWKLLPLFMPKYIHDEYWVPHRENLMEDYLYTLSNCKTAWPRRTARIALVFRTAVAMFECMLAWWRDIFATADQWSKPGGGAA